MGKKTDPRIKRTRKLIMDAFITLSAKKSFDMITVKDITEEATINRATFYYHFKDKYDLIEQTLKEDLLIHVISRLSDCEKINKAAIRKVFLSLIAFHNDLSSRCERSYHNFKSSIEVTVKRELADQFYHILLKNTASSKDKELRLTSVMLSWAIYGVINEWRNDQSIDAEQLIETAMPILLNGLEIIK
ncbi:TetR/AcrR family transcriptional regulator [Amphibacillus cookii]|uniref:TetR/AcrR family transcriptional regulator n=1 Tax=Amphibacillus cookii TaxID=767787 RepID=UPI00195A086B|nr:TetR/AcrR family transcriptional regulator [Amphibacillus cookii]MBM7542060.1 AcrR family transcriptional regulator [Amphibacillus cookii]